MKKNLSKALFLILITTSFILFKFMRLNNQAIINGRANMDLYYYYLPFLQFYKNSVISSSFPLWNPYQGIGRPFFATAICGFLYPLNWLIFLMDVPRAMFAIQLLDIAIGMVGTILFLKRWKLSWFPVSVGAILFAVAVLDQSYNLAMGSSFCWLPLILLAAQEIIENPRFSASALLAIFLCLSFFGGQPQYFFYNSLLLFFYVLTALIAARPFSRRREFLVSMCYFGIAVIIVAGLVSIQLLPTYELSGFSIRRISEEFSRSTLYLPDSSAVHLLLQYIDRVAGDSLFGMALVFVPFAFVSKRLRVPVACLAVISFYPLLFVLSKNNPSLSVFGKLPFSDSFRFPQRFLGMMQFPVAALAAIGISTFAENIPMRLRLPHTGKVNWGGMVPLTFSVAAACLLQREAISLVFRHSSYIVIFFPAFITMCIALLLSSEMQRTRKNILIVLFVAAALFVFIANRPFYSGFFYYSVSSILLIYLLVIIFKTSLTAFSQKMLLPLICSLIIVDVTSGRRLYSRIPAVAPEEIPEVASQSNEWLAGCKSFQRLLIWNDRNPNLASVNGCFNVSDYEPFTLTRWKNFVRLLYGRDKFDERGTGMRIFYGKLESFQKELVQKSRLLGLASVKYLFGGDDLTGEQLAGFRLIHSDAEKGLRVYENVDALPRTYLVDNYIVTANEEESLLAVQNHIEQLANLVVLEGGRPSFAPGTNTDPVGDADILSFGINEITVRVRARSPALLVLTDSYFPGWRAAIDGRERPIYRANYLLRAVEVPTGEHTVEFSYRPLSFLLGATVTAVTALSVIIGLALEKKTKSA